MFGLFGKAKPYSTSDKIWMTGRECWKGLATDAMLAITRNQTPVVLCFFQDVAAEVFSYLAEQSVPVTFWEQEATVEDKSVIVADVQHVDLIRSSAGRPLAYFFAGHYPIVSTENTLLERLSQHGARDFTFYMSMDSPLLEVFGTDNFRSVVAKLGLKEDEYIEHAMVTRSIQRAREKITGSVRHEHPCVSEKEWYSKNVKKK